MNRIANRLAERLFDRPLIQNDFRGVYVEEMILVALEKDGWSHSGGDWASWDLEHESGARLEVKQSAALQTWGRSRPPSFDIRPRTGYWLDGSNWVASPGRQADIYVFAWHPISDPEHADHRDPDQWRFYIAPANALPTHQKTAGLSAVRRFSTEVDFGDLSGEVRKFVDVR